jgi:hypothetical protein
VRYSDEQVREFASEVVAGHRPDAGGRCPTCRSARCAAYRLAVAVLEVRAQAGPNAPVIGVFPVDSDRL